MNWYLITKSGEYRLGRFTDTARDNHQRHGWHIVARWALKPTNKTITEKIFIEEHAS